MCVCGGEGRGGGALTPKLDAKLCQLRSNTEIQLSTQCRACSIFSGLGGGGGAETKTVYQTVK